MPHIQDFVPIEEDFQRAGTVFVSGNGSWLTDPAVEAFNGSPGFAVDVGQARLIDRGVVVDLRCVATTGPFATLDADVRLEPMPPPRSHLSLSGSYEPSLSAADGGDAVTQQHSTESRVRRFLVGVAVALERGRAEFPPQEPLPPAGGPIRQNGARSVSVDDWAPP